MANPVEIDIETLLNPISEESPSGAHLRYEGTYERVREARREDDPTLPQGVWERPLKKADWAAVIAISVEALSKKTKDLQIAVWLGEAWINQGGISGFRQTLELCCGLCDRFWDTLYPVLSDGDPSVRVGLVDWLDDVAARELRQIPLTEGNGQSPGYCLADWEAGLQVGARARRDGDEAPPEITHESFLARLSLTPYTRWAAMKAEVNDAAAGVTSLGEIIKEKTGGDSALRKVVVVIEAISSIIDEGLKATVRNAPPGTLASLGRPTAGGGGGADASSVSALTGGGGGGPINSRIEAYTRLTEAADYLLRTEPHSPVPYLVKRAISWGNMSLGELLYEFIGAPEDLVAIQRLLGMRDRE